MWLLLKKCFSSNSFPINLKHFNLGHLITRKLCSSFLPKGIDNVLDKVVTLSIKDNERDIGAQGLDRHTTY